MSTDVITMSIALGKSEIPVSSSNGKVVFGSNIVTMDFNSSSTAPAGSDNDGITETEFGSNPDKCIKIGSGVEFVEKCVKVIETEFDSNPGILDTAFGPTTCTSDVMEVDFDFVSRPAKQCDGNNTATSVIDPECTIEDSASDVSPDVRTNTVSPVTGSANKNELFNGTCQSNVLTVAALDSESISNRKSNKEEALEPKVSKIKLLCWKVCKCGCSPSNTETATEAESREMESNFRAGLRSKAPRPSEMTILSNTPQPVEHSSVRVRVLVTMFILLMSVIGCTLPAFSLYGIQFLYLRPEPVLLIVNMMVGRTFFNLIPIIDSLAIMRHLEFRMATRQCFRSIQRVLHC